MAKTNRRYYRWVIAGLAAFVMVSGVPAVSGGFELNGCSAVVSAIAAKALTEDDITITVNNSTGSVIVSDNGNTVDSSEYSVEYYNGTVDPNNKLTGFPSRHGSYIAHVEAEATSVNYTGSKDVNFTVDVKDVGDDDFVVQLTNGDSYVYTGAAITPEVTCSHGNANPVKDTDYSVSYSNNTDATGEEPAHIIITGKSPDYKGEATTKANFTIVKKALNNSDVTEGSSLPSVQVAEIAPQTYTGVAIEPALTVTYNGIALQKDVDYTVTYSNNTDAGTAAAATITACADSNFSGSRTVYFTINPFDITNTTIAPINDQIFTHRSIKPVPDITFIDGNSEEKALTKDTDFTIEYQDQDPDDSFDCVIPGTITATITGTGNFTGTTTINYNIVPKALDNSDESETVVLYSAPDTPYTGEEIRLVPTIIYNSYNLYQNLDYTIEGYTGDLVNVGTVTITIKAVEGGNFTGTHTIQYNIIPKDLDASVEEKDEEETIIAVNYDVEAEIPDQIYTGEEIKPESKMVLTYNENVLIEGTDFKVVGYENNINAGTATITLEGMGNYGNQTTRVFTIVPKDLGILDEKELTEQCVTKPAAITLEILGQTVTVERVYDEEGKSHLVFKDEDDDIVDPALIIYPDYSPTAVVPEFVLKYGGIDITDLVDFVSSPVNGISIAKITPKEDEDNYKGNIVFQIGGDEAISLDEGGILDDAEEVISLIEEVSTETQEQEEQTAVAQSTTPPESEGSSAGGEHVETQWSAKAVVNEDGSVTVSWPKKGDAESYIVFYRAMDTTTGTAGAFTPIKVTIDNSENSVTYKIGDPKFRLENNKYYQFMVGYVSTADHHEKPSRRSEMTSPVKVYYKPAVKAVPSDGSVKLTWKKVEGATRYRIFAVTLSEDGKTMMLKRIAVTTKNVKTIKDLDNGTTYRFAVKAKLADGTWSTVTTSDIVEAVPTNAAVEEEAESAED